MKILGHPRLKLLSNETRTIITAKPLESGGLPGANFSKHKRDNNDFDVEDFPWPWEALYGMVPTMVAGFSRNNRYPNATFMVMESFTSERRCRKVREGNDWLVLKWKSVSTNDPWLSSNMCQKIDHFPPIFFIHTAFWGPRTNLLGAVRRFLCFQGKWRGKNLKIYSWQVNNCLKYILQEKICHLQRWPGNKYLAFQNILNSGGF